jgi:hypothetical protein
MQDKHMLILSWKQQNTVITVNQINQKNDVK